MTPFGILLTLHISAGVLALTTLAIPLITKKGGVMHRRVGWVYTLAMAFVSLSALLLASIRIFNDQPGDDVPAYFLLQVAILTGHSVYGGVRATRRRKAPAGALRQLDYAMTGLLLLASIGLGGLALQHRSWLLAGFSLLGLLGGATDIQYLWRGQHAPRAWFFYHLRHMLGSGIATVTAVLVVNAPRLQLGTFNIFIWLTPTLLGNIGIVAFTRYYRRRFLER